MTARANHTGGLDARSLREEIEQLRTGIEQERSKRFVNRVVEAAQRTKPLREEIEQLRSQLEEANEAVGQDRGRRRKASNTSAQNSSRSVKEGSFVNSSD